MAQILQNKECWGNGLVNQGASTASMFLTLHVLIQIALTMRVLLRPHREPASRIAWVVVIVAMPVLGILAYILVGETNIGQRLRPRRRQPGALDAGFEREHRLHGGRHRCRKRPRPPAVPHLAAGQQRLQGGGGAEASCCPNPTRDVVQLVNFRIQQGTLFPSIRRDELPTSNIERPMLNKNKDGRATCRVVAGGEARSEIYIGPQKRCQEPFISTVYKFYRIQCVAFGQTETSTPVEFRAQPVHLKEIGACVRF